MIARLGAAALLMLAVAMPAQEAAAQDPLGGAIVGGGLGAIIGGAVGGGRGAAIGAVIGAASGAIIASEGRRMRNGYYYWRDGCYIQRPDGSWMRVEPRFCGPAQPIGAPPPPPPPPPGYMAAPPPPPPPPGRLARCSRLPGFDPATRTFVGRDGFRHPCP